jgi:hypothetical protein
MATDYTSYNPTTAGVTVVPVAVSATGDTVDGSAIVNGAILVIQTAGTGANLTFVDPGVTPAGTAAGTVTPIAIGTNTTKAFGKAQLQGYINASTNKVGLAFSAVTNITAFVVY